MMKRKYIPIHIALKQAREVNPYLTKSDGICACYDIEDMGFCRGGKARWYHFDSVDGVPSYTIKY